MCPDTNDPDPTDRRATTPTDTTTVRHDWAESGPPSVLIVEAIATATDRTVTDLPPLRHSVDPEALDALLTQRSSVTVSFRYVGAVVSVSGNGTVEIRGLDDSAAPE